MEIQEVAVHLDDALDNIRSRIAELPTLPKVNFT